MAELSPMANELLKGVVDSASAFDELEMNEEDFRPKKRPAEEASKSSSSSSSSSISDQVEKKGEKRPKVKQQNGVEVVCDCPPKKLKATEMTERILALNIDDANRRYFAPQGADQIDHELWRKHFKQIVESEGFDVEDFPNCLMQSVSGLMYFGVGTRPHRLANVALAEFNSNHQYELVRVIKVNTQAACGLIYFITFQAIIAGHSPTDGPFITFQARVWDCITPRESIVQICRIKHSP